jgi:hypothetical protein
VPGAIGAGAELLAPEFETDSGVLIDEVSTTVPDVWLDVWLDESHEGEAPVLMDCATRRDAEETESFECVLSSVGAVVEGIELVRPSVKASSVTTLEAGAAEAEDAALEDAESSRATACVISWDIYMISPYSKYLSLMCYNLPLIL